MKPPKTFACRPNCGQCCIDIPLPERLLTQYRDLMQRTPTEELQYSGRRVRPVTADHRCIFLNPEKKCAIYEHRPIHCRNFGQVSSAQCIFIRPDGVPRGKREWL